MKKFILTLALIAASTAQAEFSCDDPEVKADSEAKMEKHGHSPNWQHLYATWLDLCQEVREGKIEQQRAHGLFKSERANVIWKEKKRMNRSVDPVGCH